MNLYHYTDVSALKSMLEYGQMWLTDIRYLNDSNEYKEGEQIVCSVFQEKAKLLPTADQTRILAQLDSFLSDSKDSYTFIGSFSRGEDLLSQWRGYCPRTGGYALQFQTDNLKSFGMPIQECVYLDNEKNASAETLFDMTTSEMKKKKPKKAHLFQTTWANVAKFKNSGFHEEKEIRAVIFQREDQGTARFRTRNSTIIPYLPIELPWDKLKAIWIGPCQEPSESEESLRRLLRHLARDPKHPLSTGSMPQIIRSKITFRG